MIQSLSLPEKWARLRELLRQVPAAARDMRHGATQVQRDEGTRRYVADVDGIVGLLLEIDRDGLLAEFDGLVAVQYGGGA